MKTEEMARFRSVLGEQQEHVRRQLTDLGANPDEDTIEAVGFDFGFADSAQSTAERAKVLATVESLRAELHDIVTAIARIDKGSYGSCERCEAPISPERLEALPRSRLCVACKQKERV